MYVPEIIEVKDHLENLKSNGLVKEWELPYENILTRRSAAIFFLTPVDKSKLNDIWKELDKYENMSYRENTEKKLSQLMFCVTFSKEELEKNLQQEETEENKA